ncbi:MAG: UDP-glucose 4-epimerase GalE [Magnetococcus sp. THC-1_WYH]
MVAKLNRTVLITGGAGYIGSHTCKQLAAHGYSPVVYDSLSNGHREAVQWGPLEVGDLGDENRLLAVMQQYQPQAVIHFAALIEAGESVIHPGKFFRNNIVNSLVLLEVMKACNVNRLIFSSTASVYGNPLKKYIDESHPLNPINPYGISKRTVEEMIDAFGKAHGFRYVCLRYFNASGADPDGQIGEDHVPETHLIPSIFRAITGKMNHFTLFGNDYDTPDGTCVRDYVHVNDLALAHILSLDSLFNEKNTSSVYNVGNGQGFSVQEVLDTVERVIGRTISVKMGQRRAGDPGYLVADASRIIRELAWKPQFTQLDEIVRTAWLWEQKKWSH